MNVIPGQPKPLAPGRRRSASGANPAAGPRVVVGVDGSADSVAALLWAAPEARRRDALLQIVSAWDEGDPAQPGSGRPDSALLAARLLDRALKHVLREKDGPERIACNPVKGDPGEVLLAKARGADLLVLGVAADSDSEVPGATGLYCLRHAHVPVVFIAGPFRA
jgi:nucleotide-binding universal stress UspA family protein